ncbi:MAG: DoxX family membrane protein [Bacteroidota bacterium]
MKIAVIVTRIVMGLLFLVSSLGFFFQFMPQPELQGNAATFMTGMGASGYLLPVVKVVELLCAVALLSGRFVPLATVIIFPITLNIVMFHVFLAPDSLVIPILLLVGNLLLAVHHRKQYQPMVSARG